MLRKTSAWHYFLIVALVIILPTYALAFKIGPAEFQETFWSKEVNLFLRGAGLKKFVQLKVFACGLYLPAEAPSTDALTDISKRLEVVYLLSIPGSELQNATTTGIKMNTSSVEFNQLKKRIDQMNAYYPNVKNGDRITVTYVKGKGSEVRYNDVYKGTIAGADFAKAFFAIWIGQKPVDERLKKSLLTKK